MQRASNVFRRHISQMHNYVRVIRFHVPSVSVQGLLAWLNSSFSQHGVFPIIAAVAARSVATHNPSVIALGGESLEVSQQLDDGPSGEQLPQQVNVIIVDALMSFVSHQDYAAVARQLDSLLRVCTSRCTVLLF